MQPPFVKQDGGRIRESLGGWIDPVGAEKDALEREIEETMMQFWQGQIGRIKAELEPRIPDSRKAIQLPLPFWAGEVKLLLRVLLGPLQTGAEGGVGVHQSVVEPLGIGIDWTLPFAEAAKWAREYSYELVKGITEKSQTRLQQVIANWVESEHTLPELWKQIEQDPAFDRARARLIGTTEATRVYAEGELAAGRVLERESVFEYEKHWESIPDGARCLICEGLQYDGTNAIIGIDGLFPNGELGPPAHPGCRCGLVTVPRVPQ